MTAPAPGVQLMKRGRDDLPFASFVEPQLVKQRTSFAAMTRQPVSWKVSQLIFNISVGACWNQWLSSMGSVQGTRGTNLSSADGVAKALQIPLVPLPPRLSNMDQNLNRETAGKSEPRTAQWDIIRIVHESFPRTWRSQNSNFSTEA